jgi:hypothetical protein
LTSMFGVEIDPDVMTNSVKLDQLLGLVATMNTRLDRQSQRMTTVETTIPLLTQACSITLPTGSARGSSGTFVGSGAAGGLGSTPPRAGNDDDPGDGQDFHASEPAHTGGNTGSSRGGDFTTHGGGGPLHQSLDDMLATGTCSSQPTRARKPSALINQWRHRRVRRHQAPKAQPPL